MSPYSERYLFAQLFHFLSDPVFVVNEKNKILICNDACVETYGYTKKEFEALDPDQVIHSDYYGQFQDILEKTLLSATELEESVHIKKDGSSFPVEVHYRAEVYGDETSLILVVRDLTERKKAEEEFETLFNVSPDMIGVFNTEGRLLKVNLAWKEILGYSQKELHAMNWPDLVHPDDVENTDKEVERQLKGSTVVNFINRYKHKDGSYRSLEWNATFAVEGIVFATARDVTESIRTAEALLESKEKYQTLFENMAQGVFYQGADGILIDCNEAALEMFGLTRDQFLGRTSFHPDWKVIDEDGLEIPAEQHPSMLALQSGEAVLGAVIGVFHPSKDDYIWLVINAIPQFKPEEEKPFQVFVTMHDITDRIEVREIK